MALATTYPYSGVKVLLESATVPGTFVAPCGLTGRSVNFSKEMNEVPVVDCDNDDLVSPVVRDAASSSVSISGDGVLARESLARWRAAYESSNPVLTRVLVAGTLAQGGGQWEGSFHVTSFNIGGEKGQRVTAGVEMLSTGAVVWTAAAA